LVVENPHGTVCKEADRFAVGEVDGDLDVGSSSEALRMQAVSWLVNWGLGAVGPGGDVASAIAHLFRAIGSLISVPRRYFFAPCTALNRGEELR
jgi:hypothetical protein